MAQNHNKKGFTLPELLAVMTIMAILAVVSAPFIRDYIQDSANEKAKTLLVLIAEAHKTFRADYPKATITAGQLSDATPIPDCKTATLAAVGGGNIGAGVLFACNYLHSISWGGYRNYDFFIGNSCGSIPTTDGALACLKGKAKSGAYGSSYFAWVDKWGHLHKSAN